MKTAIVGIGNPTRGDDGLGHAVVEALPALPHTIVKVRGEATEIMDFFSGFERLILVDAMLNTGAGTLRINAIDDGVPRDLSSSSTHAFGLSQAIELGRALGDLPKECWIIAVSGRDFEHGAPLSDYAASNIPDAIKLILSTLNEPS